MERANKLRFAPICNYVFMHGTSDHQTNCRKRHMLLNSDMTDDASTQIKSGTLSFHVLDIISPSEYIIRPDSVNADGMNWESIKGVNEFNTLNDEMQTFYQNDGNITSLVVELGEKCAVKKDDHFYRGEIIEIFDKRLVTIQSNSV